MRLKKNEFLRRLEQIGENPTGFATRCGVSRQAMSAWINGTRFPKAPNVKTMAEKLHCGIEDIAEPQTQLENVALHGDKFAQSILGMSSAPTTGFSQNASGVSGDDLLNFIAAQLAEQTKNSSQSEVARRLGVSVSQINRLMNGKADLSLLPVAALEKLCPDLINRDTLTGVPTANGENSSPQGQNTATDDPFLKIVLETWENLSFEERGRLAGMVRGFGAKKPALADSDDAAVAICPKCGEKITEPHHSGDKFECPHCGQHLKIN